MADYEIEECREELISGEFKEEYKTPQPFFLQIVAVMLMLITLSHYSGPLESKVRELYYYFYIFFGFAFNHYILSR